MGTTIFVNYDEFSESKTSGVLETYYTGELQGGWVNTESEGTGYYYGYGTIRLTFNEATKKIEGTGTTYDLNGTGNSCEVLLDENSKILYYGLRPTA